MEYQSPFHTELLSYLLCDVERRMQEAGLPHEKEWTRYRDTLQTAIQTKSTVPFADIIHNYQQLVLRKNTILEKNFLELCSAHNWKILRGLPRVYHRDHPLQSEIKKEFSHLGSLKKLGLEKGSLPLYQNLEIPKGSKICLFTYMLSDGWGDFIAMQEAYKILKVKFPQAIIHSVLCIAKHQLHSLPQSVDKNLIAVPYEKDCRPTSFSEAALEALRSSALIISLPTFYPHMDKLQKFLIAAHQTPPKLLSIGQYGFLESDHFHPKSGNYSMGLHFLEKGIFIRDTVPKGNLKTLQNKALLHSLFGVKEPQDQHVEHYLASHDLYLAYLTSPIGGAIYLHALLQWQKPSTKAIDICTPDLSWFIEYVNIQAKQKKPLLEGDFGIQTLEIHFQGHTHTRTLASFGKTLRILCPGTLSNTDFRNLMSASQEFVAVRGDQSFSEAVSTGKLFFYDGASHARYFIKDLLALAENRLSSQKMTLNLFRSMGRAFLYNLPESKTEWVEETYFQEKEPWGQIAATIALSLKSPQTTQGCKLLCQIIRNEYSFNKTLCHLVQREFNDQLSLKKEPSRL